MNKYLILYASATGMTQDVATQLHQQLLEKAPDYQFELLNVRDISPEKLTEYSIILFGTSSWDHGIPCPDGEEFMYKVVDQRPDLSNVKFGIFGTGESSYPEFCGALPLVQQDFESCGATTYPTHFTIDGFADRTVIENLTQWALTCLESLKN